MDQAEDIPNAAVAAGAALAHAATVETAKLTEAPAVIAPKPSISAIEMPTIVSAIEIPAIELPKTASEKPSFQAAPAEGLKAESIGTEMFRKTRGFIKPPRISRFAQLAAAVVLASGFGAFAGVLGATGFFHATAPAPIVTAVATPADTKEVVARLSAELATVKAGIENTARNANAQFAKLADRFDRAEKAQAEPAAKLSRIGETLERLERRPAASIPVAATAPETTGSIAEKQSAKPAVVEGWILRDIYDGVALVESRRGLIEVSPGSNIPGIGRVETIKKLDGRWVVVTPKGNIVSAR